MQLCCTALPLCRARRSLRNPRKERWSLKLTRHNGRAGKHGTYNVMPEIAPTPTGSEGDTQQINQMYSDDDKSKTADLRAVRDLLDKRQSLSDQIEQLEQEKAAIEQQVKLEMQDAAYGTAPGYKVSWVSSESKRVDSQRLKKEQPDIFNQYSKSVSSRRFTIIHAA